jgi:outer membrane protein assembly factor BamB
MLKTKFITTILVAILISSMVFSLGNFPETKAQATMQSYSFIGAIPNPVGIGQEVLLHIGITRALQLYYMGWDGLTVTVTRPDGTTETLGPFTTDSTGGTGTVYVPTMAGNYTLQTNFPEQITSATKVGQGISIGTTVLASSSENLVLTVQEQPIPYYPGQPLPTEYWTRPIDSQLREWNTIAGNWVLGASRGLEEVHFNQDAPDTAHILWAKQLQTGGLAGGIGHGPQAYEDGDAYEGLFAGSVIIAGVLYYNQFKAAGGTDVEQNVVAVDLHTGKELWTKQLATPDGVGRRLSFGQVFYFSSFNYHAVFSYLWTVDGSTWHAFDPFSGRWVFSLSNVPTGTTMYDPSNGNIYRYSVSTSARTMTLWNLSRAVQPQATGGSGDGSWVRNQMGSTINATRGIEWTVQIPQGLPGSARAVVLEDKVFGSRVTTTQIDSWAFSLEPGQEGQLLFNNTWNAPADWAAGNLTLYVTPVNLEDEVFTIYISELRQHYGFSITTGQQIWGPTPPQYYLDYLGGLSVRNRHYQGMLISAQMSGIVYAYDITTGTLLWTYEATDQYSEILWANNWPMRVVFFTDGKIYLSHSEHSPIDPKPRGAPFICLNATTGEVIWRIDGAFRGNDWGGNAIIGDSIIASYDSYDQQIYAVGKGPSAVKVSSPDVSIELGKSVVIRGTVTDISPGTEEYDIRARFPNGVPVIADEHMSNWMLYVYKQFAYPVDLTGVPVTIDVIDANGNYRNIATTVSDASGMFSYTWQPDIEGSYTVIATFAGSKSYYPSYAQTTFAIDPVPEGTSTPTPAPASLSETYFIPAVAGLIIAMIIGFALIALLLLKKRP